MSKKVFISSNQYPQTRQIQKFQLPQRKQGDTYYLHQQIQNNNHGRSGQSKIQKIIYDRIAQVQNQNKKLLDIANQLNSSSMNFNLDDRLPNIVYPIEEQMKLAFNELIESIQEFYIDIDSKIKQIGAYLATLSGIDTLQTSKKDHEDLLFSGNHQQKQVSLINQQQTIRSINQKIETLQKDLQQTKSNQNKLMTIIEKLVQKYQLTNQTTMVRQDPFLNKKVQNLVHRIEGNQVRTQNNSPHNSKEQNYSDTKDRFHQANTFAKPNHFSSNQNTPQLNNFVRGPLATSNAVKRVQNPQRNVSNNQNPNDYSICHQLNKIQQNPTLQNQRSFISNNTNQVNQMFVKNKQKPKLMAQKMDASMLSVNSYAYSNSIEEQEEEQCFIKKLYSKQTPTLNKVSLKSCTNPNKTVFQLNRPQEQAPIDQSNKNHRQAYLLTQLKRFN